MEDKKEKIEKNKNRNSNKVDPESDENLIKEGYVTIIAGPCAIESFEQLDACARVIKELGLTYMRGGAYKPRTSPYSFQGLKEEGLKCLREIGEKYGLKTVTEVTDTENVEIIADSVDVLQIGTRNMSNFALLEKIGRVAGKKNKKVILKRGWASSIKEWLLAVEYITFNTDVEVVLCERGIRTFETSTRFTLDLSAVPVIKKLSKLPIIVDPSHAVGQSDLVIPMSRAAIAVGADGLLIESHINPSKALCDGQQQLSSDELRELIRQLKNVAGVIGKKIR
ncbi:MAG: 3-deoxy-7-phosphoheptulonate synthase [Candidatus Humimicrobiaceae bacterium]|jgi:3-deoxy-7-phosphoheptulonate synthase|nr:3-deoxy-7-phosphoheptulonate synthase [Candidatus Humimicrobiaceae bacterium]